MKRIPSSTPCVRPPVCPQNDKQSRVSTSIILSSFSLNPLKQFLAKSIMYVHARQFPLMINAPKKLSRYTHFTSIVVSIRSSLLLLFYSLVHLLCYLSLHSVLFYVDTEWRNGRHERVKKKLRKINFIYFRVVVYKKESDVYSKKVRKRKMEGNPKPSQSEKTAKAEKKTT